MKFVNEASKLLTNKYFLYFMVFLTATNMLGYFVTKKTHAVMFFLLVSLLTYQFSKNMAVVLLISIIATNFLMANKKFREGLENQMPALSNIEDKDPQIAGTIPLVQQAQNNEEVANKINEPTTDTDTDTNTNTNSNIAPLAVAAKKKIIDTNNSDLNNTTTEDDEIEGFGDKMGGKKSVNSGSSGPRIDYASTIEQSYGNLDNLLGSDSIKQLTSDTQNLMKQQQNLFNTMNQMVPVLEGAQNMLKNFDMGNLGKSLKNITGLSETPFAKPKNNKK
jgi:hypothetical protein